MCSPRFAPRVALMQGVLHRIRALDPATADRLMAAAVALFTLAAAMIDPAERTPRTAGARSVALASGAVLVWRRARPLLAAVVLVAASAIDAALGGHIN